MTTEQIKQKRLEILNDTVKYFNSNNRAYENGQCKYLFPDGRKCAIGRLIPDNMCEQFDSMPVSGVFNVFSLLPKDIAILGEDYLTRLQSLHDNKNNWNDKGLSENGLWVYERIKKEFHL